MDGGTDWKWSRVVLLEFPSATAARGWADPDGPIGNWHRMRNANATSRMIIIESGLAESREIGPV